MTREFNERLQKYIESRKKVSVEIGSIHESIFPVLTDYLTKIMKVGNAINWQEIKPYTGEAAVKNHDKITLCFFGECGTGKSTDLSVISRIYRVHHQKECKGQAVSFVSG